MTAPKRGPGRPRKHPPKIPKVLPTAEEIADAETQDGSGNTMNNDFFSSGTTDDSFFFSADFEDRIHEAIDELGPDIEFGLAEVALFRQAGESHREGLHHCHAWSLDMASRAAIDAKAQIYKFKRRPVTYFRLIVTYKGKIIRQLPFQVAGEDAETDQQEAGGGGVLSAVTVMVERMMQQNADHMKQMMNQLRAGGDMMGQLAVYAKMKEVFGSPVPTMPATLGAPVSGADAITQAFDLVEKVGALQEKMGLTKNSGDDSDTFVLKLADKYLPRLFDAVESEQELRRLKESMGKNRERYQRHDNPAGRRPAESAPPDGVPQQVIDFLTEMQTFAVENLDPDPIADDVLANKVARAIIEGLKDEKHLYKRIVGLIPEALDYPSWWGDFIDLTREKLSQSHDRESDTNPPAGGTSRDGTHDGADAQASA